MLGQGKMVELALQRGAANSLTGEEKAGNVESRAGRWINMLVEVCRDSLLRVPTFSVKSGERSSGKSEEGEQALGFEERREKCNRSRDRTGRMWGRCLSKGFGPALV